MTIKKREFEKFLQIEEENDTMKLKIGDCFLYGKKMIDQLSYKEGGMEISYFKVINKTDNGIEYAPVYDILEKEKEEK